MRLIDADALIEKAHEIEDRGDTWSIESADEFEWALDDYAPTIDIEPKRGEWVERTHNTLIAQVNFAYCSECGQPIMHEHTRPLWSFCPNCGADMREREGE